MDKCKFCYHEELVRNGFARGAQRYRCKHCYRSQIAGDEREAYGNDVRRQALAMVLSGTAMREVARTLGISRQLIAKWTGRPDRIIERELRNLHVNSKEIGAMDNKDLPQYLQKKSRKQHYGWVIVGTEVTLVCLQKPPTATIER